MKKRLISAVIVGLASVGNALAYQPGDMLLRAGITNVSPNDSSSAVTVDTVGNVGMSADVDSNTQLGLNFVYFYDNHWAIEVLAATPFSHDVTLGNTDDNALGLGDGLLAEVKHLPPTVSALYYFMASESDFQPYVGLGVNYTVFFDETFTAARAGQSFDNLNLDASFGIAVQAGFDYKLNDNWHINASVRHIDIDTTATFDVLNLPAEVDVEIDPVVVSLTLGYRF